MATRHGGQRVESPSTRSKRTPHDPPLRDPTLYALTDHFRERLRQPGRYVSLTVVSDAIEYGQLRWNRTEGWRFALVREGIRFIVVVGDTETTSPVIVTAWTEIADWNAAMQSDRWTVDDVHTIRLRAALSDDPERRIPSRIRPRIVGRPFEMGDHRLTTAAGDGHVECSDCRNRFRSKQQLLTTVCHRG
ncbi:hypothetical protein AUR64_04490 [Haloprofundus marisrubri]|uniref:Uncharacterized protein n=1 Tax=Haloprofundus marisrubri TaxID=1514971 RepID=A0A0W1REZ5_9EURY|nr:hypothetical protein [Haloprofundus marisrubri]KTG11195.1 hypothetical protein AUR64_04490 [Haloprofundus marisrubri]